MSLDFKPVESIDLSEDAPPIDRLKMKGYADRLVSALDRICAMKMRGLTPAEEISRLQIPHRTKTDVRCFLDHGYYPIVWPIDGKVIVVGAVGEAIFSSWLAALEENVGATPTKITWGIVDMFTPV